MASSRVDPGHQGGTPRRPRRGAAAKSGPPPDAPAAAEGGPESVSVPASKPESESQPRSKPTRPLRDPKASAEFFAEAIKKGSVAAACAEVHRTLDEYVDARLADPAFDEAALKADRVLDLIVIDRVRQAAQEKGALAAQALYLKSVRTEAMQAPFPSLRAVRPGPDDAPTIAPEVAAAMIKAGLEAHEKAVLGGSGGTR